MVLNLNWFFLLRSFSIWNAFMLLFFYIFLNFWTIIHSSFSFYIFHLIFLLTSLYSRGVSNTLHFICHTAPIFLQWSIVSSLSIACHWCLRLLQTEPSLSWSSTFQHLPEFCEFSADDCLKGFADGGILQAVIAEFHVGLWCAWCGASVIVLFPAFFLTFPVSTYSKLQWWCFLLWFCFLFPINHIFDTSALMNKGKCGPFYLGQKPIQYESLWKRFSFMWKMFWIKYTWLSPSLSNLFSDKILLNKMSIF